jgi:hypothetical protein
VPPTSLFAKKKAVSIEVVKPLFVLNDDLLKGGSIGDKIGSAFIVNRVSVRQGEVLFNGHDFQCHLLGFNLQSGLVADELALRLDAPHLKVTLPISGEAVTLEGNLIAEMHRQGTSWKINQFVWQTREIAIHLNGRIFHDGAFTVNASAQGKPENILRPLLGELTVKGLAHANATIAKNTRGRVQITAEFTSSSCQVKENSCSDLSGHLSWNSLGGNLELDTAFSTPLARSALRLNSKSSGTDITIQNVPAAYLADILDISADAPLNGIGSGAIHFDPEFILGRVDLDSSPTQPLSQPFVARGRIAFKRDKKMEQTTFFGEQLQFNGGQIRIAGKTNSKKKTVQIKISAALENMENMATYSAFYLDINLLPWKLSRGTGMFTLELDKRPGRKTIDSRFQISNFLANQQPITSLQGEVRDTLLQGAGTFTISAPDLNSKSDLIIAGHKTTIHFRDVAGEAQKIMKILDMNLDLRGKITGDFTYGSGKALKEPELTGHFAAPRLVLMGYTLTQASGSLRSNLKNITLNGLDFLFLGGHARTEASIDFGLKKFGLQGRIDNIDMARLSDKLSGRADLEIIGRGEFLKDPLEISFHLRDMYFYKDRGFSINGKAKILTDFSDFQLATEESEIVTPAGTSPFSLKVNRKKQNYSGSFNLDLKDLDLLIPWKNNSGMMRILGQVYSGTDGGIRTRGVAVFSGRTLSLPNFSHALDNFQGTITFDNNTFILQSLSGEMGGGKVESSGRLLTGPSGLQEMTFNLQGKNLSLYPMDRVSCLVHPDLTLKYEGKKLLLSGTLNFPSLEWQREILEPIVFNTRSELSTAESKIQEMLHFDIGLSGENFLMRNSLGRINGKFKLRLTGTAKFPILSGACEGNQGEIYFSDRSFNLLKAKLVFNNNLFIDPLINLESEAFIQNYRVRFDIKGTTSRAKPELVSSPPLPPQDILALVSLGEVFRRSGSTEISSQQGGTAMISTKLTEEIKNRANKLLGINLLRIDPALSGQSAMDTSRLTIGTTISKNLIVVYSTNLSTSRQEIYYMQYQLSPTLSLIAMKNEEGRYSLDLRLRSRR